METPQSSYSQEGNGSWHPAMRPNAHEPDSVHSEKLGEKSLEPEAALGEVHKDGLPPNLLRPSEDAQPDPPVQPLKDGYGLSRDPTLNGVGLPTNGDYDPSAFQRSDLEPGTQEENGDDHQVDPMRATIAQGEANDSASTVRLHNLGQETDGPGPSFGSDTESPPERLPEPFTEPNFLLDALGDKEEMEKAWESEANTGAPGHFERTNSFPAVPPPREHSSQTQHSLSHSQAGDIMGEHEAHDFMEKEAPYDAPLTDSAAAEAVQDPFDSVEGGEDENFFAAPPTVHPTVSTAAADEESRYEEGLPLVPSTSHPEQPNLSHSGTQDSQTSAFAEMDDEDDFFDKAFSAQPKDPSSSPPPSLDRKSTSQVLDSMHYPPHYVNHTEPEATEERPSLADVTGGGIAVSTSTVKSQVFAERPTDQATSEPKDEDLAEMWKAALGDDDLLVEDEVSVDPSSFFEDDGEGFLEEAQDPQEGPLSDSTASPPILQPVYAPDGSMQGFGTSNTNPISTQNRYQPSSTFQAPQVAPYTVDAGPNGAASMHQQARAAPGLNQPGYSHGRFANALGQRPSTAQPLSRPQIPPSTQSFADKSKGGYTSPYDLPMDVTRPKKRTSYQQTRPNPDAQAASARPPPPRSSSMFASAAPPMGSQPPVPRLPSSQLNPAVSNVIPPSLKSAPSVGNFFEELPSKPRQANIVNRTISPTSQPTPPPLSPPQRNPPKQSSLTEQVPPAATRIPQQYQLVPPERMSLYESTTHTEPTIQPLPAINARYSPAPNKASSVPPPPNRYAASPSAGSRPSSQALPFQPRTSSPLAQSHALPYRNSQQSISELPLQYPQSSSKQSLPLQNRISMNLPVPDHKSPERPTRSASHAEYERNSQPPHLHQLRGSPPSLNAPLNAPLSNTPSDSSYVMNTPEPDRSSSDGSSSLHHPYEADVDTSEASVRRIPRRSQTQSPGAGKYLPELPVNTQHLYQRPASVNDHISAPSSQILPPSVNSERQRSRTFSKELNYVRPTDGRELDHLGRWKGCPIISFGFGGAIVTSFPKHIPRYAAGQTAPMIKCSPGEVKLQDGKILPLNEDLATFPGPLKSKSKKKEVIEWLQKRIQQLEFDRNSSFDSGALPDPRTRHEEKILLWKIVRVLVENDGVVDGNSSAENAVRTILSPEPTPGYDATIPLQPFNSSLVGIMQRGSRSINDTGNAEAVEEMRKKLLHGEREQAVWHAVDNRLWAHAMLLSSTLDRSIWKQVSQEFVRQEVKTLGDNTESLSALYQIFAGNWDESMDELVPPSARAGLQMVSKTASTGPTKNALDGLDRWRETLTLILSNRTPDDGNALVSLGQLLTGYGRTEAAHICYMFAKTPGLFGGPDDPQVSVALFGADHLRDPLDYGRDFDSVLLTEVYDFARTVLASSSAATVSPHLQSYKLYHAMILAEYGYKTEAQQYCDVITSALKSTTKPSPYYHSLLFGALDNLTDRLRQAPRDSSGSWISKPSIDKVSGSIWAKFNQYVAGDESDAASTGSSKAPDQELGPFGRVNGDSPTLSRNPSSGDLYSSYPAGMGLSSSAPTVNASNSRYAPAALHTPRSSLEQTGRSSQEYQRPTQGDLLRPSFAQQQYHSRPTSSTSSYHEPYKPVSQSSNYPARSESYMPTPPSQPEYMPVAPDELSSSLYQQDSYQPSPHLEPQKSQETDQEGLGAPVINSYEPPLSEYNASSSSYEPPSADGYEPPTSNGYEPPSYNPDVAENVKSPVEEKPKKKSFIDDDEGNDFEARAAALRKAEKERKDREAEEAFRRAAEADGNCTPILVMISPCFANPITAQKDKAPQLNAKKSGWLGGWFGGKKDGDAAQGTPNAPIRAKLGEQSSFYYDPEKKRWIDKKNPDATPAATATPPPPKGPASRAVSGPPPPRPASTSTPPVPPLPMATSTPPIPSSRPPTSNNLSQPPSPAVLPSPSLGEPEAGAPQQAIMRSVSGPPSGPPSAPPSRPPTSMSNASSIDDLIGAPQARKGGTVRKGKKGRGYVDVMAK